MSGSTRFSFFLIFPKSQSIFELKKQSNKLPIVEISKRKSKQQVEEQIKLRRVYDEKGINLWNVLTGKQSISFLLLFGNEKVKKLPNAEPDSNQDNDDFSVLIPTPSSYSPFLDDENPNKNGNETGSESEVERENEILNMDTTAAPTLEGLISCS